MKQSTPRAAVAALALLFVGLVAVQLRLWPPQADAGERAIAHAAVYDLPSVSATADILTSSITPKRESSALRITVALDTTDSVFNVTTTDTANSTTYTLDLNSGTALTAGNLYTFTVGCRRDCTYNFQVETGTNIAYLVVDEAPDGAP